MCLYRISSMVRENLMLDHCQETALDAAIKEAHTRVSKFLNSIERAHRAALNSKPINEHPPEQNTTNNNASESEAHYKEFSITSEDSKQMVATLQQVLRCITLLTATYDSWKKRYLIKLNNNNKW